MCHILLLQDNLFEKQKMEIMLSVPFIILTTFP